MNKRDKRVTRDMRLTMLKIHNDLKRISATGATSVVHELPPERRVGISTERIFNTVYPGFLRNRRPESSGICKNAIWYSK